MKFRKTLLALVAFTTIAVGVTPAEAQYYHHHHHRHCWYNHHHRHCR